MSGEAHSVWLSEWVGFEYVLMGLRSGGPEETVTHAIFECPPALHIWSLSTTPSSPNTFLLPSTYANMTIYSGGRTILKIHTWKEILIPG